MSGHSQITTEAEKIYRVGLWQIGGVGYVTFHRLIVYFGSARVAFEASDMDWKEALGDTPTVQKVLLRRKEIDVEALWQRLSQLEVKVLCLGFDPEYPSNLASIEKPPPLLFVRGLLQTQDNLALAVVGTRKPTDYGIRITAQLTRELVASGCVIVSGLAMGIDGVAHTTALDQGGRTVAVLGGGIDRLYPREHERLARRIIEQGAIVSTFPVGELNLPANFAIRNRFVAGLALGVVVTEGASKSGTRITAEYAIEQQKPVFAVPGDITRPMSQGPVELLKKGGVLVTSGPDVLNYLKIQSKSTDLHSVNTSQLSEIQRKIFEFMKDGITDVDQLAQMSMMPVHTLTIELTLMEMERLIERTDRGFVVVDR